MGFDWRGSSPEDYTSIFVIPVDIVAIDGLDSPFWGGRTDECQVTIGSGP